MSPPRWDHNTTCKFVELYIQQECLWNMNLAMYRSRQARDKALKEIVQEMAVEDFGVEEAKQKIKSIRATYQQEKTKIIKSEKSGVGAEEVYKPNMKWFSAMHGVMNNGQLKRNTTSNMGCRTPANNDDIIETDNENILTEEDTQESNLHESAPCNSANNEGVRSAKRPIDTPTSKIVNTPTSKRSRNKLSDVKAAIQDLQGLSQAINRADVEDECEVFGRHIAMQLKKLPDELCITAQDEIQRVLTRSRLNALHSSGRSSACFNQSYSSQHSNFNPSPLQGNTSSTSMTSPLSYDTLCGSNNATYTDTLPNMSNSQASPESTPGDILSAAVFSISDVCSM